MTKEVYEDKMMEIIRNSELAKKELHKQFAYANNPYKIGDIIKDNGGSIMIERIQVYIGASGFAQCVYTGIEYTKKGEPNKKGNKRSIYQNNIKTN